MSFTSRFISFSEMKPVNMTWCLVTPLREGELLTSSPSVNTLKLPELEERRLLAGRSATSAAGLFLLRLDVSGSFSAG